jgi:hypothetical protein
VTRQASLIGTLAALAILGGLGGASYAAEAKEKKPKLVSYKKDSGLGMGAFGGKLLHSYGYKDKKLENGNWETTGQARSSLPSDSQYIAIYRAAEIALAENKKYISVVSINGKSLNAVLAASTPAGGILSGGSISYGTRYVLEFQLSDVPDAVDNCVTDVLKDSCKTIEVAGAMQQIGPFLKIGKRS